MTKKPKTEYRVVCAKFGTRGHSQHVHIKASKAKAVQSVIDANHHADVVSEGHFYKGEAPWRTQERDVSAWRDSDES